MDQKAAGTHSIFTPAPVGEFGYPLIYAPLPPAIQQNTCENTHMYSMSYGGQWEGYRLSKPARSHRNNDTEMDAYRVYSSTLNKHNSEGVDLWTISVCFVFCKGHWVNRLNTSQLQFSAILKSETKENIHYVSVCLGTRD